MAIVALGIDLAKNVFALHGVDATGKPALVRPSVPHARLLELVASLPPRLSAWRHARAPTSMRFVPPKSLQQQSELMVHRARQGFVAQRTATINRIRGLLLEFGIVLPLKAATVRRQALLQLEDLPGWANTVVGDLLSEVHRLNERAPPVKQVASPAAEGM